MRKTVILLAAIMALLALAGCTLAVNSGGTSISQNRGMTAYEMFEPANEQELMAAGIAGDVNVGYIIVKASKDFDPKLFQRLGAEVKGSFEINGATYYRVYRAQGAVKLVTSLRKTPGIIYAQHELLSRIPDNEKAVPVDRAAQARDAAAIAAVFNDPMTWGRFGHFETTKALEAYQAYGVGDNIVYVVDIDTGINRTHEDFALEGGQIVEYAKSAFNSIDGGHTFEFVGDGNLFVDVPYDENWDENGHGTHTAGTIAALGNNGKGVAGVAWKNVRLISYKCFSDTATSGSGSDWAVYGGLADLVLWKKANNINQTIPVNMSLGGSYAGYFELEMINLALANDIMIIASMGNDGYNYHKYPASYAGVMAIGATRADGSKVHFSTSGSHISVSAPGYDIYSTYNEDDASYTDMSGTSMSTPFVTGTVAYLLTFNPNLKPDQLRTIIENTATDIGDEGWDEDTGAGLVNVKAAADIVKNGPIPAPGSKYSTKTVKFYVRNLNPNYDSGLPGYRTAVVGQSVYLYDSNGDYVSLGMTNAIDGSVEFRLLKPGTYKAVVNYLGEKQEKSFTISNVNNLVYSFNFDIAVLMIQTIPNLAMDPAATSGADTILTLYDDMGNTLFRPYDSGIMDSIAVAGLQSGKTYIVGITQYGGATGEYGLYLGFSAKSYVDTTNGRGLGPDDDFEENDDLASAKQVTVGTEYGVYLGDADYYYFVMP